MTTTSPDARSFLGTGVRFPMTIGPDGGFGTGGQNIHYLEKQLADRKDNVLSIG